MSHPHLAALRASADAGRPIIASGIGCGLTAQGAMQGGADLLAVYNTAVYRIRNLPSILAFLPGEDPNQVTRTAAVEVVANAGRCPVLLGFAAHNPQLSLERLLDEATALGGAGVTNEPFTGLYGETFRIALERAGCGFSREVQLIEAAKARDLLTLGWACDPHESARMAEAGADLIGLMLGITEGGAQDDLQDVLKRTRLMADCRTHETTRGASGCPWRAYDATRARGGGAVQLWRSRLRFGIFRGAEPCSRDRSRCCGALQARRPAKSMMACLDQCLPVRDDARVAMA